MKGDFFFFFGVPGEKPSEKGENLYKAAWFTHGILTEVESNPGQVGGRQELSPLYHPCSPKLGW